MHEIPEHIVVPTSDIRQTYLERLAGACDIHVDWNEWASYAVDKCQASSEEWQATIHQLEAEMAARQERVDSDWLESSADKQFLVSLRQRLAEIGLHQFTPYSSYAFHSWMGDDLLLCRVDVDPMSNPPPRP